MKQISIWRHLKLDSFGVEVPFSKSRNDIVDFFRENNIPIEIPTEMQIVAKSKLLSLDVDFFVSFQFSKEKLISITISPDTALEGKALDCRYRIIQKALEKELGHPKKRLRSIMNLLNPDNRSSCWQSEGVKIEHYILNRFGMEEIISIEL